MTNKILLTIIALFSLSVLPSTRGKFYTVESGLSQSNVRALIQDKQGFMWLGTWDGLNRFDGYSFRHFKPGISSLNSVNSNSIIHLYCDSLDKIWLVLSDGRVNVFNKSTEEFISVKERKNGDDLLIDFLSGLRPDARGNFWAMTKNGMVVINSATFSVTRQLPMDISNYFPNRMFSISINKLLYFINSRGFLDSTKTPFDSYALCYVTSAKILLGTTDGDLYEFDVSKKIFTKILPRGIQSNDIGNIYFLSKEGNNIWIASATGLKKLQISHSGNNTLYSKVEAEELDIIKKDIKLPVSVFTVYRDVSGVLWVGLATGLYKINPLRKKFEVLPKNNNYRDVINANMAFALYPLDNNLLLIGTRGGLFEYNFQSDRVSPVSLKHSSHSHEAVIVIFRSHNGKIWLGTKDAICEYNPVTKQCTSTKLNNPKPNNYTLVTSITEDDNKKLWLGTTSGIFHFDPIHKKYTTHNYDTTFGVEGDTYILSLLYSNGYLWAGTNSEGLLKINTKDMSYKRFLAEPGKENILPNNKVTALFEDDDKRLWIATLGGGISVLSEDELQYKRINESNGLPNNSVYGFLNDDKGNLWLSTNNGICRINKRTLKVKSYSRLDGLPSVEYNQNSYAKGSDGQLYFGGVNGIVRFHPKNISDNPFMPSVVMTNFHLFNTPNPAFTLKKEIELTYNQNFISIELAGLLFENPESHRYAFLLEGYNKDWVELNNRRIADLSNIPPGEYTFKAKAANEDNIWSNEFTLMKIIITPPFWQTLWFRMGIVLLLIILLLSSYRIFIKRKYLLQIAKLENEKLLIQEQNKLRDKISRDLHDDLASTVSSLNYYIQLMKQVTDASNEQFMRYLNKSSDIIVRAEEAISDIVWSVSPYKDSISDTAKKIETFIKEVAEASNKTILFTKNYRENFFISSETRKNIYLIAKEAVYNAIKYSSANRISVLLYEEDNYICLKVEDNGKGFSIQQEMDSPSGNGLLNLKRRAGEINAELQITSEINNGTTILLKVAEEKDKK